MKPLDPRLVRRSASVRRYLVTSVALGTFTAGLVVAQAWLIAQLVARGFGGSTVQAVAALIAGLAAVFAGRAMTAWLHHVASDRAAAGVKSQLRTEITAAVLDPERAGERPAADEVAALLGTGLDALDAYFARYLPQLALAVTVPLTVIVAMFVSDVTAALTVAVTLPLIPLFMALVGWVTRERTERRWNALLRLRRHFSDVVGGIVVLKQFDRDQHEVLARSGEEHRVQTIGTLQLAFLSTFVLELLSTICVALVAVGVGLRIIEGDLVLSTGLFVLLLAPEAFSPVRQVGAHFHASADGVAAAEDAFAVLDYERHGGVCDAPRDPELIEFDRVAVRFAGRSTPALGPVRFSLRRGDVTVIAGPSGSGKSTMLAVLLGLVEPTAGRVLVDGVDLLRLDLEAWRSRLAWVAQTPGLIAGTIEDNVRFGNTAATTDSVRAALDAAGASDLALQRLVGERGATLSAGERRRVGVARALLRVWTESATILLLDEPTAGLDARNEERVVRAVASTAVTVVLVSHRPVHNADAVVVLDGARA